MIASLSIFRTFAFTTISATLSRQLSVFIILALSLLLFTMLKRAMSYVGLLISNRHSKVRYGDMSVSDSYMSIRLWTRARSSQDAMSFD